MRFKDTLLSSVSVLVLTALALAPPPAAAETPPPGYNVLQDVYVFDTQLLGTWSGGDLIAPGGLVPVDTDQIYEGRPSLRYEVTGPTGWWWLSILAGDGWVSYSLENHVENGSLEFNVKGLTGGEQFNLAVVDVVPGRSPVESERMVSSASYVTVTTDWQHVSIPLRDLVPPEALPPDGIFNPRQIQSLRLSEPYAGPYAKTFWINNVMFSSPDPEPSHPAIKVNQVGYLPLAEKYALVSGFPESLSAEAGTRFEVRRASDGATVHRGHLALVDEFEAFVSGEKVLKADFSCLVWPGRYYLTVEAPGIEPSPAFEIGWHVYRPMLRDVARYFFYQRQGIPIDEPHAEGFPRGEGHPGDVTARFRSSDAEVDVSQGWYDAGDYGKYTPFAAGPITDLLDAYALFPWLFRDGLLNLPESGNRTPDLLDEVAWELDWLLKMQDPVSGGFYHLVYPNNCPGSGSCRPEDIVEQRYVEDLIDGQGDVKPTASTAKAVAALARAAHIYRRHDRGFAAMLLAAAEAGWDYLEMNPDNIPATGFNGAQGTDDQERFWAAGELFRATGDRNYGRYYLDHYRDFEFVWTSTTDNAHDVAMRGFLAYNSSPRAHRKARRWFRDRFSAWRAHQLSRTEGVWRNFLHDGSDGWDSDYYWGSNAVTLQTVVVLTLGNRATGRLYDPELIKAARAQLNYILGVNPLSKSYVTGYGGNPPSAIYSHIYSHDDQPELPPGILAEGPNQYQGRAYSRFHGKCYADTNSDWTVSEHAIYYNAYLVFTAALAQGTLGVPAF